MSTWEAANRLVSADVGGVVSSFDYNGLGHPVSACAGRDELAHLANRGWRNNPTGGFAPEDVLDTSARLSAGVAGGPSASLRTSLPEVIVATTSGTSTHYVQVQGQILAQYDTGTWAYALPDHLGSAFRANRSTPVGR